MQNEDSDHAKIDIMYQVIENGMNYWKFEQKIIEIDWAYAMLI